MRSAAWTSAGAGAVPSRIAPPRHPDRRIAWSVSMPLPPISTTMHATARERGSASSAAPVA
ncbi:hypothetical protein QP178_10715 [Sphingomonas aurantiaca]|uniref:hypothetical protein n=1 Tax=Sphingomonas aurantiaca TaxID=185949 RepID=UPI002FDF6807